MSAIHPTGPARVKLPKPTVWPLVLALGISLAGGALVGPHALAIVGGVLALAGAIGWFFQVLPRERHEEVPILIKPVAIPESKRSVARVAAARTPHRARLPLEIYPISAGLKGGLAGGVAMALAAALYGIISHHSIWYPINLLGAVVYARTDVTTAEMSAFHVELFAVAFVLHLTGSVLVGLLYGAILPMLARHPVLLGGLFAPVVWTGLLHSVLDVVDPILNQRIDWIWFLISQVAFGVVAGLVVIRQVQIPTWQFPLAARMGVETPGIMRESDESEPRS